MTKLTQNKEISIKIETIKSVTKMTQRAECRGYQCNSPYSLLEA